ncbi:hypothetical protein BJ875DRAFT_257070 [Amylocarpus encephaloides]|uniref:SET domain-containing protein n=1 Tax=Amylocarpus encephaloides TaxID=45428 RepID=A0A9P8BYV2_9HELO|nr:hypothetical protein BJ875DRAFT_257070 [Amylocarpus encephaloides]
MDPSDEEDNTHLLLLQRAALTAALQREPYDLILYLERAKVHGDLGYPDLSASDCYRALLLSDECANEEFEYHEQALEALRKRCTSTSGGWQIPAVLQRRRGPLVDQSILSGGLEILSIVEGVRGTTPPLTNGNTNTHGHSRSYGSSGGDTRSDEDEKGQQDVSRTLRIASIRCYQSLSISLLLCGCLKSAYEFCLRGLAVSEHDKDLQQAKDYILLISKRRLKLDEVDVTQLPDQGLVRREIYPWNTHEPNRYSQEALDFLNKELATCAPKLEARVTELPVLLDYVRNNDAFGDDATVKQLGLFAKVDIEPGEEILDEISLLVANNVLKGSLCDACSAALPPLSVDSKVVGCPDCHDIMFCDEDCFNRAQESYHPSVCDKDVDTITKDPDPKDKPFALYLHLLGRALAMSATQEVHPLELTEVRYVWGDFIASVLNTVPLSLRAEPSPVWTLPFSFSSNITGPLHLLEKMDIDVFESIDKYDTWIINTLYSKFRGTASARANERTGHPEVAAVHPLWCLANHDCDPNVKWEWGGRMRFWCRDSRVGGNPGGIKKGGEILNHYTDIDLDVKERREWAMGSLGGFCMCERCKREAGELGGNSNGNDTNGVLEDPET